MYREERKDGGNIIDAVVGMLVTVAVAVALAVAEVVERF